MLSKNVAKLSGCNMGHAVAARLFLPRGVPSIRAKALSRTKISSAVPSTAFFASEVEDQDSGNLTLNHISVEDRFHQPSIRPSTSTMISMRSDRPCTNSHLQYVCIVDAHRPCLSAEIQRKLLHATARALPPIHAEPDCGACSVVSRSACVRSSPEGVCDDRACRLHCGEGWIG